MKIEIKDRWNGSILFSGEFGSLKLAVEAAWQTKANLRGANLTDANLMDANLTDADLRYANLTDANLTGANLTGADLMDANLTDADLRGANLTDANLMDANLTDTNLRGANLTGADLRGAHLTDADLTGAKGINKNLVTPLRILLAQPGFIRAYKLVNSIYQGPFNGGITYEVGQSYAVENASTDEGQTCVAGIHLATLDWVMKEWKTGYRILLAEFTAADIAAIPTATDGKFRVHRCKIVGEVDLKKIGIGGEV